MRVKMRHPSKRLFELLRDPRKQVVELGTALPESRDVLLTGQPVAVRREAVMTGELFIEVIEEATGEVVESHTYNTLTSNFRAAVASLIIGGAIGRPTQMKLGTGTTANMTYASSNQDGDAVLGTSVSGAGRALSQGFTISDTQEQTIFIARAMWWLKRVGTPTGSLWAEIWNASGGGPTGAVPIWTSSSISAGVVGTTYDWNIFNFPANSAISKGTQYALVIQSTGYVFSGGVTEIDVGFDNTGGTYAGGYLTIYSGAWTLYGGVTTKDAVFRLVTQPQATVQTDIYGLATGGQKNFTSTSNPSSNVARLLTNYITTEAIEYLGHIGMFNAAGTMHAIAAVNFKKTSSQSVNVYWVITVN